MHVMTEMAFGVPLTDVAERVIGRVIDGAIERGDAAMKLTTESQVVVKVISNGSLPKGEAARKAT